MSGPEQLEVEPVAPEHRLRLCVLGDFDGIHTRSWLDYFVQRGHDVHAVSYYPPGNPLEGVQVHSLRPSPNGGEQPASEGQQSLGLRAARKLPQSFQRFANLLRYRRAGLRRAVDEINPELLHAHYVVEHGFYGTAAARQPYIVSAWGSDILVDSERSPLSRAIARFVLQRAKLATANNRYMAREMVLKLGIERAWVQHIVLGASRYFLERPEASVNVTPTPDHPPTVISTRSLDTPLYNIDTIVHAMARVRRQLPQARLVLLGEGRQRPRIEALVERLGLADAVKFRGFLDQQQLRDALAEAEVFVSVPSSDATSVALLQAMAVGVFPVISDLPSQQELVEHGAGGLRVPVRDERALADAILEALEDGDLRRSAAEGNRRFVVEYGLQETNMAKMEAWYYRLAGRTGEAQTA